MYKEFDVKKILLLLTLFVFSASTVYAACTPEQMQQKAMQASTQIQALMQKDANRGQQLMQELAAKSQDMQAMQDMDAVCNFYDELIEKTK